MGTGCLFRLHQDKQVGQSAERNTQERVASPCQSILPEPLTLLPSPSFFFSILKTTFLASGVSAAIQSSSLQPLFRAIALTSPTLILFNLAI